MKRRTLLAATAPLLLAGCADLMLPTSLRLGADELRERLAREFPQQRRLLDVVDVTVGVPSLQLRPQSNRLAAELTIDAVERLFGNRHRGRLALDAGLRFEPSDQSVRLAQVRVERFEIDGASAVLQRLGALVAERAFEDLAIYRVPPDRVERLRRLGQAVSTLQVTPQGLEIGFAPTR